MCAPSFLSARVSPLVVLCCVPVVSTLERLPSALCLGKPPRSIAELLTSCGVWNIMVFTFTLEIRHLEISGSFCLAASFCANAETGVGFHVHRCCSGRTAVQTRRLLPSASMYVPYNHLSSMKDQHAQWPCWVPKAEIAVL